MTFPMSLLPVSRATESDLSALIELTAACIARMRSEGIEQWDEVYPAESDLRRDVLAKNVWVLRSEGEIVGCMTLDGRPDPLWASIPWQHTAEPIGVVHRLMIVPSHQGRGLARRLMNFAEAEARRQGFTAIRLDSFLQNPTSMALYKKLGYTQVGTATMRKGQFAGFEKNLALSTDAWPKPEPRELAGRFITLAPVDLDRDIDELFTISHETLEAREIWRYLPPGPFTDAADQRRYMDEWISKSDVLTYVVFHKGTGRSAGSLSLINIRPEHGVAEIGFVWFALAAQGTKINTEANYLLLRYCFEELRYRRMEWKCNSDNERSHRAALRLGFRYEGTFRQHMAVKGRNRDTVWLAMLDFEWPHVRAQLERTLYATDSERW
jgi:RimJ/RimL family protein N-acetyltransferase